MYRGKTNIFEINLKDSSCKCQDFVKDAVCFHMIAYSNLYDLDIFESCYSTKPKNFAIQPKRGRPKKKQSTGVRLILNDLYD